MLCERCLAKGLTVLASEVHHRTKCHDNVELQVAWDNLEALCPPCHRPLQANDRRGYSREIDSDGYFHRPQAPFKQTTTINTEHRGGGFHKNISARLDRWGASDERLS